MFALDEWTAYLEMNYDLVLEVTGGTVYRHWLPMLVHFLRRAIGRQVLDELPEGGQFRDSSPAHRDWGAIIVGFAVKKMEKQIRNL